VLDCPKVNYKLNYKPGLLICPRTKKMVPFDDVKDKLRHYTKMPLEFKKQNLQATPLVEMPHGKETQGEMLSNALSQEGMLHSFPFAYQGTRQLMIGHLTEKGQ